MDFRERGWIAGKEKIRLAHRFADFFGIQMEIDL